MVETYSQEVLQVDKIVRMDLSNQEEIIQKRLERRRSTSQTRKEQKTPERRKLLGKTIIINFSPYKRIRSKRKISITLKFITSKNNMSIDNHRKIFWIF